MMNRWIKLTALLMILLALCSPAGAEQQRQMAIDDKTQMVFYFEPELKAYLDAKQLIAVSRSMDEGGYALVFYALSDGSLLDDQVFQTQQEVDDFFNENAVPVIGFTNSETGAALPNELSDMEAEALPGGDNRYTSYRVADLEGLDSRIQPIAEAAIHTLIETPGNLLYGETYSGAGDAALGNFSTVDIYDEAITPSVFDGYSLTMVNVWATYCSPCINSMPELVKLAEELKDKNVQMLGVVSDTSIGATSQIEYARDIVEATGATAYRHLVPDDIMIISKLMEVQAVPSTFFVDGEGRQRSEIYSGAKTNEEWNQLIDGLLAQLDDEAAEE